MTPELFRSLLKGRLAAIPKRSRGRIKAPKGTQQFPKTVERAYAKAMSRLFKAYTAPLMERIKPILENDLRRDSVQMDFLFDDLEKWDTDIYYNYQDPTPPFGKAGAVGVEATVASYGWDASLFNEKQWRKLVEMALPDAFPLDEPWVASALEDWTKLNAALVDKAATQFYATAETTVRSAVQTGRRAEEVMHDLKKLDDSLTDSRARLIARDQIGTLNGLLTQKRNESAGIGMYTWATAMDERVRGRPGGKWEYSRDTHWIMEGKLCRWDNPAVYSDDGGKTWLPRSGLKALVTYHAKTTTGSNGKPGKASLGPRQKRAPTMVATAPDGPPGIPANCRCGSRPYLDSYIEELAAELAEAGL